MGVRGMDNVLIVVDDLEAAKAFFVELGMELEGEMPVEGRWVDLVVGLENVRCEIAMMRTPDGHGRLELTKLHAPAAATTDAHRTPRDTPGLRRSAVAPGGQIRAAGRTSEHAGHTSHHVRCRRHPRRARALARSWR